MTPLVQWTSALDNHLWQSTVFAAVPWLLAFALRKNQARTRYWLWMIASAKFVVPFSWFVSLGAYLGSGSRAPIAQPRLAAVVADFAQPFPAATPVDTWAAPAAHDVNLLPVIFLTIWACGFVIVAFCWSRKWWRVRSAVRTASRLDVEAGVPVLSSRSLLEPGIFGVSRPVLLLPDGITDRLTPAQMDAIVAHEMCHVRRHDNLTAAIHMAVEAVFWFHPLVWWIGSRMVEERERACDEEVLRLGGDPEIYAEGILNVCKFYVESPLTCVSGISGSDLKERIVRIMTHRLGGKLSLGRKLLLSAVGVVAVTTPIVFGLVNAPRARAQSQVNNAPLPSFEVASIRPDHSGSRMARIGGPGLSRFAATNVTLKSLITFAYDVRDFQVSGGPGWIASDRFDIDAKVEDSLAIQMQKLAPAQQEDRTRWMVQSLLTDRFKLSLSHNTKELPIYALVVVKGGPKIQDSKPDDTYTSGFKGPDGAPLGAGNMLVGRGKLTAQAVPMADLVQVLSDQLGRIVLDKTGLAGNYDFILQFTPENPIPQAIQGPDGAPPSDSSEPSIFTALQEQLGLRLESTKGPVDTIVIDHIEEPSEN